jgi:hypothetical protein
LIIIEYSLSYLKLPWCLNGQNGTTPLVKFRCCSSGEELIQAQRGDVLAKKLALKRSNMYLLNRNVYDFGEYCVYLKCGFINVYIGKFMHGYS